VCFLRGRLCGAMSSDPHGGGLGADEPDGIAVVVKIRAPAFKLFVCLGGGTPRLGSGMPMRVNKLATEHDL
jgi:hypothetical protein